MNNHDNLFLIENKDLGLILLIYLTTEPVWTLFNVWNKGHNQVKILQGK